MKFFLAFLIAFSNTFAFGATKTILKADIVEGIVSTQELIGAKGHFEKNSIGWNGFDDGAATSPVDGTGGTVTTTCTRSTSSPIDGDGSFLFTKTGGASYQGEGCSLDFTIPANLSGTVLRGSFEYAISSGTYADDAVQVWLYNVTDGALSQPAPTKIKNHSLNKQIYDFEFQPTYGTSAKTWRVILHIAATDTTAYTLKIDNWKLGAYPKNYGSSTTDWISYTPTWTASVTNPAIGNGSIVGWWRKVGDSAEVIFRIYSGTTTTYGSGDYIIGLPTIFNIDSSKTPTDGGRTPLGAAALVGVGAFTATTVLWAATSGANTVKIAVVDDVSGVSGYLSNTLPETWSGINMSFEGKAHYPVLGWSSSQVMSSDADTRVITLNVSASSGSIANGATDQAVTFSTTNIDDVVGWNGTTTYTVKVPGKYDLNFVADFTASITGLVNCKYKINSSATVSIGAITSPTQYSTVGGRTILNLVAGDALTFWIAQSSAGSITIDSARVLLQRISGPAQIAQSESIDARASGDAASASVGNPVIFPTIDWSTHGSYSASTGLFTCPVSGKFQVSGYVNSANATITLNIAKDGTTDIAGGMTDANGEGYFSGISRCLAGQTLSLEPSGTLDVGTGSWISFMKVGNY